MKNPYTTEQAVIKNIKQETAETKTYLLTFVNKRRKLEFSPGQFNMISLPGIGEGPFSIASSPLRRDGFEHTVRVVGDLTGAISRLDTGSILGIRGPYGRGWPVDTAKGKDILIVAGGVGLAPLRGVIELITKQRADFGSVEIMYGTRRPDALIYANELDLWRIARGVDVFITVDEVPPGTEWPHHQVIITNLLSYSNIDPAGALALICGPEIMMSLVARSLTIRGFTDDNIFVSLERRMECGMAKCGRCMLGGDYICTDGPVFSYAEVKALPQNLLAASF